MDSFTIVRNGYNKEQVDRKISDMNEKNSELSEEINTLKQKLTAYEKLEQKMIEKDENISIALTAAVEKAKQIEKSSQNVYKLKIQQLELLYARWEKFLAELIEKHPDLEEVENVKMVLEDFKSSVKTSIKEDFKFKSITTPIKSDNDPIRLLLSKMNTYIKKQPSINKEVKRDRKQLNKDMQTGQSELSRIEEKAPMIRPIYDSKIEEGDKYDNLLDKFLTEKDENKSAYANQLTAKVGVMPKTNETGFDLKEAVNPKDDLEQIMKSFDFFENNEE